MQLSDKRRHRSWRRIAAPLGLAAALVAGSVSLSAPAHAAGAPYTDPHSLGRAELLDGNGNEVVTGSSNTPFATVVATTVGTGLAEANFRGDSGDPADSYAAQTAVYTPVAGVDPGSWTGNPVNSATTQTAPATNPPTATNSAANASQNASLETLISAGGGTSTGTVAGFYEIRLLSVSNDNGSADQYYTADISLNTSSHTFTVVGPGSLTASTTSLATNKSSVSTGGSVTLTAQVSPTPAPGTNDLHDVTFRQGSTIVAAHVPVDASGKATFMPTLVSAGSYSYTATYNGDTNDLRSTSTPVSVSASAGPAPYTDAHSLGRAELLDSSGREVLSGSTSTSFPAIAASTVATGLAETGWRGDDGVTGDTYAAQTAVYTPIAGADPSTWSGNPVNAATTQTAPATNPPTASNTAANASQNKSLETLIAAGGGTSTGTVANYYQIRLLSSNGDQGAADKYYTVDVSVDPNAHTLTVVGPGSLTASSTSLTPATSTIAPGANVTLTAQVSPAPAPGPNDLHDVTFRQGGTIVAAHVPVDATGKATYTATQATAGSYSYTATYNGDTNDLRSISSAATVSVVTPPTTTSTTVSASPTSATTGSPVTFTAQVSPTPDGGTVSFTEGNTTYAAAVAVDGTGKASTTVSTLTAGTHTITATYSGDTAFSGSSGVSPMVTVTASTVTGGAPYTDPSSLGRAELLDGNGNEVLSGASNVPFSGLVPTTTGTGLAPTMFRGDSGDPSDSYAAQTAVYTPVAGTDPSGWSGNPVNSATTQTAPATNPPTASNSAANASQNKSLETLIANGGGTSTGSVAGYYQIRLLSVSNDSGSAASYYTVDVKVDTTAHTFTVVGPGTLTATSTALSADNNRIQPGGSVTLTAQVTPAPKPGANDLHDVTFRQGGTIVAAHVPVDATGKAVYVTTLANVGSYSYTATYNGDTNDLRSSSAATTVVVATGSGATATTTTVTASPTSATAGSPVTFTAQVSPTPDGGTVTFTEGSTVIASNVPVDASGKAVAMSSSLAVGTHTVTATYSGDTAFTGSHGDSPTVTITPAPVATTVSLTADNASVASGQTITFTASVAPAPDGGSVTFYEGSTPLSSINATGGTAKFTTSSLSIGSHTVTAVYGGDAAYAQSPASNAVTVSVTGSSGSPSTTTAITGSASAVTAGQPVTFTATISPTPDGGTVSFSDSGAPLGPDQPVGGNTAVLSTSALSIGVHSIVATYSGTANYLGSVSSAPFVVTVVAPPVTTPGGTGTTTTNAGTGAQVRSGPTSIPVGITVSSPNGIKSVTLALDGGTPKTLTAAGSRYATDLSLKSIKLGTHTLTFRTTDGAGVVTTTTSVFVLTLQAGVAAPNRTYAAAAITSGKVKNFSKTSFTGAPGKGLTTKKKNASISFSFYGNALAVHLAESATSGKVRIIIDGKKYDIDLYSAKGRQLVKNYTRLAYAKHNVQIIDLGTKNSKSKGTTVTVGYIRPTE